ncbi:hypothetical protein V8E53_003018 [Lactarius tabidus]
MGTKLPPILHVDWFTIDTQSFNSLDQSPCTVTAYLMATCYGGAFGVHPLALGGSSYAGPTIGQAISASGACWCNTVIYNLASACSECQGGQSIYWSEYYRNCSTILAPATFPNQVPAGTRIPRWVLLEIPSANYWSPIVAQRVGDFPEIPPGGLIDTPVFPPTSTTSVPSHSSVPAPTSSSHAHAPISTIPSSGSSGVSLNPNSFAGCVTAVAAIAGVILSLFS